MFAVLTGSRGASRGVAGSDWVVAGSSGARVSASERRINKARASGSGGTIGEALGSGCGTTKTCGGGGAKIMGGASEAVAPDGAARADLRWSQGVGEVSG